MYAEVRWLAGCHSARWPDVVIFKSGGVRARGKPKATWAMMMIVGVIGETTRIHLCARKDPNSCAERTSSRMAV
jgi:hypothetical protein